MSLPKLPEGLPYTTKTLIARATSISAEKQYGEASSQANNNSAKSDGLCLAQPLVAE